MRGLFTVTLTDKVVQMIMQRRRVEKSIVQIPKDWRDVAHYIRQFDQLNGLIPVKMIYRKESK